MFIDSHAHLDSAVFSGELSEILDRARRAEVNKILTIGCLGPDQNTISRILALVESRPNLYAAFGVHPHDARFFSEDLGKTILQSMNHPKVLGWGEIGLDFHYEHSPREKQYHAFRRQLQLALEADKPVIIHSREAEAETCCILEEEFSGRTGVLHCFTGQLEIAQRCLQLDFYLGLGGTLTFKKSQELRQTASQIPGDRLLIETDSPYLAPVPYRGKRNEPAFLTQIAEILARIRGTTGEKIGLETSRNFANLFAIEH